MIQIVRHPVAAVRRQFPPTSCASVLAKLLLLFIVVPLVELALLFYVADKTGPSFTLLLVIVTGFVGAVLARRQGWWTLQRMRRQLAAGQLPTDSLWDALLIFMAGALLLTPGILTDTVGFSLLVPACRRVVKAWLLRWFRDHFAIETLAAGRPHSPEDRDQIIDAHVAESSPAEPDYSKPPS